MIKFWGFPVMVTINWASKKGQVSSFNPDKSLNRLKVETSDSGSPDRPLSVTGFSVTLFFALIW